MTYASYFTTGLYREHDYFIKVYEVLDSDQKKLGFNQKSLFRPPNALVFPFAQSVMKQNTRQRHQAVLMGVELSASRRFILLDFHIANLSTLMSGFTLFLFGLGYRISRLVKA